MGQLIISIRLKQDLQFEISLGYTGDCFKTKMKKSQTSKNKKVTPKHKIPNWTHLLTFTKNFIAPQPVKNTLKTQQCRKKKQGFSFVEIRYRVAQAGLDFIMELRRILLSPPPKFADSRYVPRKTQILF